MVFCVGLTGGLASGKSAASGFFAALGAVVADADESSRRLTAPDGAALPALRRVLGAWAFDDNGHLRRRAIRRRVFAEPSLRRDLEKTIHPLIQKDLQQQLDAAQDAPYVILSAPLLLETGMFAGTWHRLAVIDCLPSEQISRACRRDDMSAEEARALMAAQCSRAVRLARADDIIDNSGTLDDLRRRVEFCHRRYLSLSSTERKNDEK